MTTTGPPSQPGFRQPHQPCHAQADQVFGRRHQVEAEIPVRSGAGGAASEVPDRSPGDSAAPPRTAATAGCPGQRRRPQRPSSRHRQSAPAAPARPERRISQQAGPSSASAPRKPRSLASSASASRPQSVSTATARGRPVRCRDRRGGRPAPVQCPTASRRRMRVSEATASTTGLVGASSRERVQNSSASSGRPWGRRPAAR